MFSKGFFSRVVKIWGCVVQDWMEFDEASFTEIDVKAAESIERDQTARKCSLTLIYTLRQQIHNREQRDKD